MPSPERKIGTRQMDAGETTVVVYSYPNGLFAFICMINCCSKSRDIALTTGPELTERPEARASQPTMVAISCTRAFVSREFAVSDRNWESLACRQGCVDTCAFEGRAAMMMLES
jgi:hypothetical protein